MAQKLQTINTEIPFYELQNGGCTLEVTQTLKAMDKDLLSRSGTHRDYDLYLCKHGNKYPIKSNGELKNAVV